VSACITELCTCLSHREFMWCIRLLCRRRGRRRPLITTASLHIWLLRNSGLHNAYSLLRTARYLVCFT
jgi:hypothetical protein